MENTVLCLEGTNLNVDDFVWAENQSPSPSLSSADHGGHGEQKEMDGFPEVDLSLSDDELVPLLHSAATSWGFFRVFNHGIPQALLNSISVHALRFFNLPLSDKLTIARGASSVTSTVLPLGYTGFARNAVVKSWSEALQFMPGEERICGLLNQTPFLSDRTSFCAELIEYFSVVGVLAMRIIHLLFRGLDVDEADLKAVFNNMDSCSVRINYYPPCPVADCTYGSPPHKDFGAVTILHQDDTGGLEVLKDGRWVGVKPRKGYLVVNVGDLIQVLSNARYESVLHRSLVNSFQSRLSFVFFYFPHEDSVIAPLSKLVTKDNPAKYKSFYLREYQAMFIEALKANHSPSLFFKED